MSYFQASFSNAYKNIVFMFVTIALILVIHFQQSILKVEINEHKL
jgi:hypothetical protein